MKNYRIKCLLILFRYFLHKTIKHLYNERKSKSTLHINEPLAQSIFLLLQLLDQWQILNYTKVISNTRIFENSIQILEPGAI